MKFLDYRPFEGKKFQHVGRVVRFILCQTPTGVGDDSISTSFMSLVEHNPQTRPTSIGMELKRPGEIHIDNISAMVHRHLRSSKDC